MRINGLKHPQFSAYFLEISVVLPLSLKQNYPISKNRRERHYRMGMLLVRRSLCPVFKVENLKTQYIMDKVKNSERLGF